MTGLANRKWRDIWEHKGRASGINNTDGFLQQEHPSLFLLPFAPEVMGSGLGLGVLKTLGGYAGSYAGSKIGNEVGYALDNTFNKQLFEPLGEIVGSFAGFGKGYNLFGKAGMQGALKYLSKTGKEIPRWFMRPELKTNIGRINQRTFFAEDQTPKYNSNQITVLNRHLYQSPATSQLEVIPQVAYASEIPMIAKQNTTSITDAQWDAAYNEAVKSGNIAEIERLRKLHFIVKTPGNKLVNENNNPHLVWHGSPENWTIFDDWKRGTEDIIYFSTDKSYADQFTIPRKDWKVGMIPTKSSRSFYLYGKEPLDIGTDMDSQLVQEKMRQAWLAGQNPDSAYGMDAWIDGMPLKQSNGIEFGVLNRKRMKLSDPITYDDNEQIIPLSKRDDFTNPDIRYGYASPTATKGSLKQLDNFIEYDVFPRLQRAGHNVAYDKTTMPTLRQFDPVNNPMDKYLLNNDPIARNSQGMFHSATNTAMTIDKPSEANYGLLAHEIPGHAVRYNINSSYKPVTPEVFTKVVYGQPLNKAEDQILLDWNNADQLYTPIEESLLKTSYEPFFKGGEAEGKLHDYGAVNTQLRASISQKNNYAVDTKLDTHIDNLKDVELLKMLLEQPYTKNGTTQILKDTTGLKYLGNLGDMELTNILSKHPELSRMLKRIKDTMKYVAGVSAVGIGMNNIPQKQE